MLRSLARAWSIPDNPPDNPGAFVVLSYALRDRSTPTRPTRALLELAAAWWNRFPAARVIVSTGDNQGLGISNAAVMAQYAVRLGIPAERIVEEDQSINTAQNLQYSMSIIQQLAIRQPTLITLDLHTRRAVATARKLGWKDFCWLSAFSEGEPAYGYKWLQTSSRLTMLSYEIGATLYSKLLGWI